MVARIEDIPMRGDHRKHVVHLPVAHPIVEQFVAVVLVLRKSELQRATFADEAVVLHDVLEHHRW
ncbi:MAG: hypothetical protein AW07_00895 [Candidatus Accumulibacter sp. SK-11]|nr:MAG: hypothetical protein AW07_00895 [Candidatus Accumulibacter sp. SK-11]